MIRVRHMHCSGEGRRLARLAVPRLYTIVAPQWRGLKQCALENALHEHLAPVDSHPKTRNCNWMNRRLLLEKTNSAYVPTEHTDLTSYNLWGTCKPEIFATSNHHP